jgi:hypothetical protein
VFRAAGFNAVFGLAYVLIGIDIGLRLFMIEKKVARKWAKVDQPDNVGEDEAKRPENELENASKAPSVVTDEREEDDEAKEEGTAQQNETSHPDDAAANLEISQISNSTQPTPEQTIEEADESGSVVDDEREEDDDDDGKQKEEEEEGSKTHQQNETTSLPDKATNDFEISQIRRSTPTPSRTITEEGVRSPPSEPRAPKRKFRLPPVITLLASRRLLTALWGTWVLAAVMTQFGSSTCPYLSFPPSN